MITLQWRLYELSGTKYYYTFHRDKFWCIKSDYVSNGKVTDSDYIFQVTDRKMEEKTKFKLIERLSHLFPELTLQQVKIALYYDKNASIENE